MATYRVSVSGKTGRLASFTLIELLTVIVIIAILAALTLAAASAVLKTAARNRARTEIAGMSAALESYKTDNGAYPVADFFGGTNGYVSAVPTTGQGGYQQSSEALYQALTGQTISTTLVPGAKSYMTFKSGQLGNLTGPETYIQDPFANAYGYSTGTGSGANATDIPNNGVGFFDLWSSGGDLSGAPTGTNSWISNWNGS
jgi:prepilin-type N-terminal cleavage/methylation domain-containing protein